MAEVPRSRSLQETVAIEADVHEAVTGSVKTDTKSEVDERLGVPGQPGVDRDVTVHVGPATQNFEAFFSRPKAKAEMEERHVEVNEVTKIRDRELAGYSQVVL